MIIQNTPTTIDSIVLGNYIIKHYGPMSHLKLQKLLFYCDAYHMAYFDSELIADKFEAWVHGPVSRRVYDSFKDKSVLFADLAFEQLNAPDPDADFANLSSSQQQFINEVLDDLTTWSDIDLETATHREQPWIQARQGYAPGDKCSVQISKPLTREFYKAEING